MKSFFPLIIVAIILVLSACLDRRPGEKVRDAAEDVSDELKGAGKEIKEKVKDATN